MRGPYCNMQQVQARGFDPLGCTWVPGHTCPILRVTPQVFDLQTGSLVDSLRVADDTVNGCDFHPYLQLLAVATGEALEGWADAAEMLQ
jgi:hypothetical protein